jgi:CheY-like chemotaxis protein
MNKIDTVQGNTAAKAHVMVVEDEIVLQNVYDMILRSRGYRVTVANNGYEALELLRTVDEHPRVILLDIFMPKMDGREFLRNLDTSHYPNTKIIVSSNVGDRETIDELLALGAHDHTLKANMSPNDLVQLVETNI